MIKVNKEDNQSLQVNLELTEANLTNADEFKKEAMTLIGKGYKMIIMNLESVEYIDSSFLGALVSILKHLITVKSDLILVGLRKDVADLFTLIRLDKVFKIYPSFDDVPLNY
jgi:anti-sigma B factor antagonist